MDTSDRRVALGAGGALAVCCTVHLLVLAGGLGAVVGFAGGVLSSPYLLVGGLALLAVAVVLLLRRLNRGKAGHATTSDSCTPAADVASAVTGDGRQERSHR
ncbi:MAG: hypothetical protein ACRDTM_08240 [Micromonosporaceae bacterium]